MPASQMIRAANSVSLNIAEGAGRDTDTEFNRFLGIAVGSIFEVASASFIAVDQGYMTSDEQQELYREAEKLARSINSFRRTLNKKSKRLLLIACPVSTFSTWLSTASYKL